MEHTSAGISGLLPMAAIAGCAFADSGGSRSGGGTLGGGGVAYVGEPPACFAPGTRILLADGRTLPVEKLVVGDLLRSGPEAHEQARVAEVINDFAADWVRLELTDGTVLEVTAEHLIWIDGKGWTAARNIQPGEFVFNRADERVGVASVEAIQQNRPLVTVRLEGDVALYAEGILVHDQCGWWTPPDDAEIREDRP
jgi:hypothetical protein